MFEALILSHAWTFALVMSRVAGFVVTAPFPGAGVSRTQRAGLVAVLSWVATVYAPAAHVGNIFDLSIVLPASSEVACGLIIGCTFRSLYVAGEFLGHAASQAIGLSMASVLNPAINGEDVALSRVVTLAAEFIALSVGVHRVVLSYLLHSFTILPIGSDMTLAGSTSVVIDLFVRSTNVGLQLAMPVIAVSLVVHVGLAMIARAAPALQILNVGLGLLLATGGTTLLSVLPDIGRGLSAHYATLQPTLDELFEALNGATR